MQDIDSFVAVTTRTIAEIKCNNFVNTIDLGNSTKRSLNCYNNILKAVLFDKLDWKFSCIIIGMTQFIYCCVIPKPETKSWKSLRKSSILPC